MSPPRVRGLAAAVLLAGFAFALLAIGPAGAEQSGRDGIVVSFNAKLSPNLLPRHGLAPVSIALSGGIDADNGGAAPRLRRVDIAFGARGGLDTSGLPRCPKARLRFATQSQALARCGNALVGHGTIVSEVPLNREEPIVARATALAFNGRARGHPAVWLHAYSASPPVSFVLPFALRRLRHGAYGMLLSAPVARALGHWPRLRSFRITLGRRYRSQGGLHSYLNARCPLPPRFHGLSVPLARADYRFAPAPTIATTILRACRVRD